MNKSEYQDYLRGEHWIKLSERVKIAADYRCQFCDSEKALNVHHRSYANLGNAELEIGDLVCLCQSCHGWLHLLKKVEKGPSEPPVSTVFPSGAMAGRIPISGKYRKKGRPGVVPASPFPENLVKN